MEDKSSYKSSNKNDEQRYEQFKGTFKDWFMFEEEKAKANGFDMVRNFNILLNLST